MTLEEKIAHLQAASMEEARAEGNAIIDNYRKALEKVFSDHKDEALVQAETRIKNERINSRQQLHQASAKAQLELKRKTGKIQLELKDKLFEEVYAIVNDYMKTEEYEDFLIRAIRESLAFAPEEERIIYINPSDADKKERLEAATGAVLTVSAEDFLGGMRAVIRGRNILIDHSFKVLIRNEYDRFLFLGGDGVA